MRLRFLPAAIFATVLMLGVKVGNLLLGFDGSGVAPSHAEEAAPAAKPAQPAAPGAAKPKAGASASLAAGAKAQGKAQGKAEAKKPDPGKSAKAKPGELPSDPTLFTQAEIDLLQKLAVRRTELERWAKDLTMREQLLKATEKRIDRKVVELSTIQGKVKSMLKQYDKEQEGRLKSLVKIYENMKPKDAARIFMQLDMPILLDVVERMKERRLAPIFAKMEPAKAKRVTKNIAARRKFLGDRPAVRPGPALPASPQAAANPQPPAK